MSIKLNKYILKYEKPSTKVNLYKYELVRELLKVENIQCNPYVWYKMSVLTQVGRKSSESQCSIDYNKLIRWN